MAGAVVPEVMELMDRLSVEVVEKHYPTGLRIDGAAAVLVGQLSGPRARGVRDAAMSVGGSASGEHRIGCLKRHSLPKQLDGATLAAHRLVKDAFDPPHMLTPDRGI